MRILVTGIAGFIGSHLARRLIQRGDEVLGLDNLNDYYSIQLKQDRLEWIRQIGDYQFRQIDLADRPAMEKLFSDWRPQKVAHLAAQVGVRASLRNPHQYIEGNVTGFLHVLEGCRNEKVDHLVFASSSSVYGGNTKLPFSVHDNVDHPVSLYAATKKSSELMAHCYSHLYRIPVTGLRFFTVYGPWGRPDMAMFHFTESILAGRPIQLFNFGKMLRDFTFVEDIVEGVLRSLDHPAKEDPQWSGMHPDPATSSAPYRLYNLGNSGPVDLSYLLKTLESALGKKAITELVPMMPGDVPDTHADMTEMIRDFDFHPRTSLEQGVQQFVQWYREYYSS